MQAILLIGIIIFFSLDEVYGSSRCYKSRICIHTNKEKCGRNRDGEVRRFLDSCDMKEFNCLEKTNYVPTSRKECEDLPELDAAESDPDSNKAEKPERYDKQSEIDEDETENKSEEYINEAEFVNEPEITLYDPKTEETSNNGAQEYDPEASNEIQKLNYRILKKPYFNEHDYERYEIVDGNKYEGGKNVDYFSDKSFFVVKESAD